MLQLKTLAHLDNKALRQKMLSQKDIRLFQYWQIIHCVQSNPGKKAEEYASLLGIAKEKVYRIIQQYNNRGKDFDIGLQWGGSAMILNSAGWHRSKLCEYLKIFF